MLARMRGRDATADGVFVTGVLTTGIYCLPSCPARPPNPENVVFFPTEGAASAAGLRPCKRCRPDQFYAGLDPARERFEAAYRVVLEDVAAVPTVGDFAGRVGVSVSTLHALAVRYAGRPPGELIRRSRIETATRLLEAGSPVAGVAFEVGYESLSAFYARFKAATGSTPAAYAAAAPSAGSTP